MMLAQMLAVAENAEAAVIPDGSSMKMLDAETGSSQQMVSSIKIRYIA